MYMDMYDDFHGSFSCPWTRVIYRMIPDLRDPPGFTPIVGWLTIVDFRENPKLKYG